MRRLQNKLWNIKHKSTSVDGGMGLFSMVMRRRDDLEKVMRPALEADKTSVEPEFHLVWFWITYS